MGPQIRAQRQRERGGEIGDRTRGSILYSLCCEDSPLQVYLVNGPINVYSIAGVTGGYSTMNVTMMKSKIHQARITGVNADYEGSIEIDSGLMDEVGLLPYEKVLVANIETGDRFETYVISSSSSSGTIALNGAAARLGQVGDRVIILAFAEIPASQVESFTPRIIQLDENNRIIRRTFVK